VGFASYLEAGDSCIAAGSGSTGLEESSIMDAMCAACGFLAVDSGWMVVGAGCSAEGNEGSGFLARWDGHLQAGDGCVAKDNRETGFMATGTDAPSQLLLGAGCQSLNNGSCGFQAVDGGMIAVGKGSTASTNAWTGFLASEPGSILMVGFFSSAGMADLCHASLSTGCSADTLLLQNEFNTECGYLVTD
jgi:hypothetical protein